MIAGLCYLTDSCVYLVFPEAALPFDIVVFSYIVEVALCLWLLVKGINVAKWEEAARPAAAPEC